ncbi:hypothetical protein [Parvibacter caecicola]|uniref:RanBP2-type domain-containing protein n=1 Tax=Parvibacter caecicola TaxID=747645 RepID=A0A3N0ABV9_9ACTN|nr:hypothetical protein [Parvibacter caecicola]MBB3171824.1 hypothetical protein [Parvibacter caecicola]MCR2040617.1 hypothetical protein [Parvibacter caecicola]RNL10798.1 hypothetical protein DMP11_06010 [Parvibacter caecicola]TJW09962.1 hypothetical protein E5982_07750 [Parvibacter caecicola]
MVKRKADRDHVEVAHLSGPEGIRAAFEVLRAPGAEVPLAVAAEEVPRICWTCQKCAAENEGDSETCWNCGAARWR